MNQGEKTEIVKLKVNQGHLIKKVDSLCRGQKLLDEKIDDIMSNHIPHIREVISTKFNVLSMRMKDLEKKIAVNAVKIAAVFFIGTLVGSIIVAVVVRVLGG